LQVADWSTEDICTIVRYQSRAELNVNVVLIDAST